MQLVNEIRILTAIFAFFEAPKLKLEYYVEGDNLLRDW